MIARQSVWSDPTIVELAKNFVPAADEVGRLQNRRNTDPECELFRIIAEQGHYAGRTQPSSTRQGTYVATTEGVLLASANTNDPRRMERMLREALAKWEEMDPSARNTAEDLADQSEQVRRPERFYPEGGLVLRVNTRDLPRETPLPERWADAWNQDFAWFTSDEARQFVPETVEAGQSRTVPELLVRRIARFHLVDNIRGQTTSFPNDAVKVAELISKVENVEGDLVTLRLEGRTKTDHKGNWPIRGYRDMNRPTQQERGVETELLGHATFDQSSGRFVAFEMLAIGTRWGGTQYNGRGNDHDPAPFGALLTLTGDTHAERVAPEHFWGYGWR